jgi:uncharacterized membrane protein YheB (UPF0754 family)
MEKDDAPAVRESIAVRMLEAVVEMINHPARQDKLLDQLGNVYEEHYDMLTPDLVMLKIRDQLQKETKRRSWDSRLKLKVSFKKISHGFHQAHIEMDLDATLKANVKPKVTRVKREKVTGETISDNPSPEAINEFLETVERRSIRRTPRLSDRQPTAVREPFERDLFAQQ